MTAANKQRGPNPPDTPRFAVEAALTEAELDAQDACITARMGLGTPLASGWRELLLGFGLALAGGCVAVLLGATTQRAGFVVVMLLLAAYLAGLFAMRRAVERNHRAVTGLRRNTSLLRERRRFELGDAGLLVRGDTAEVLWSWRAFTEAGIEHGLLLLWVGHAHGVGVPTRAFAGPGEAEAALDYARGRIAAAQS